MTTAVAVVVGVFVAIGLAETVLTAVAAAIGLSSWRRRFTDLTRVAPPTWLRLAVGSTTGLAAVALSVGYAHHGWWVVGGALLIAFVAPILLRQIAIGTRGRALVDYALFAFCGVVALVGGIVAA